MRRQTFDLLDIENGVALHEGYRDIDIITGSFSQLAEALNNDENRAEAADLIRSLVEKITLTPNAEGKLDIDLYGDLAGILSLAAQKERPLDESDPSVVQVKMVAGARNHLNLLFDAPRLIPA